MDCWLGQGNEAAQSLVSWAGRFGSCDFPPECEARTLGRIISLLSFIFISLLPTEANLDSVVHFSLCLTSSPLRGRGVFSTAPLPRGTNSFSQLHCYGTLVFSFPPSFSARFHQGFTNSVPHQGRRSQPKTFLPPIRFTVKREVIKFFQRLYAPNG